MSRATLSMRVKILTAVIQTNAKSAFLQEIIPDGNCGFLLSHVGIQPTNEACRQASFMVFPSV